MSGPKSGLFAKVDLSWKAHPKALRAGAEARDLWLWCLLYTREYELDGFVPLEAMRTSWSLDWKCNAEKLVEVGLMVESEGGYSLTGYDQKNETKEEIDRRRELTKKRVQRFRQVASGNASVTHHVTHPCNATVPDSDSDSDLSEGESEGGALAPEPTKAERLANRESLYRDAYQRGISAGKGGGFAMNRFQQGELNQAIATHGRSQKPGRKGQALRGDELLRWLEAAATDFAEWLAKRPDKIGFYSSFEPRGFLKFLNEDAMAVEAREVG